VPFERLLLFLYRSDPVIDFIIGINMDIIMIIIIIGIKKSFIISPMSKPCGYAHEAGE